MMSKFLKMLESKKKSMPEMDDDEKDAKLSALGALQKMASDGMVGKLKGAKKVSVMSDSPEGLEKGLDEAKKFVSQKKLPGLEHTDEEEMAEEEAHLGEEGDEDSEHLGPSPADAEESADDIMEQIAMLKAKLKKKM